MEKRTVPEDFPREAALGAVSGFYPKLLVRCVGDKYVTGPSDELLGARHDNCEDMANQLMGYVQRKRSENSDWTLDDTLTKIADAVRSKARSGAWDFTSAEIGWMIKRVHDLLVASGARPFDADQLAKIVAEPGTAASPRPSSDHFARRQSMAIVGLFPNALPPPQVLSVVDVALGR